MGRSSCCEVSQWLEENAGTRHGKRGAEPTPRKLVRASAGKSSLSISALLLELIVISDWEPQLEDNDGH